MRILGDGFPGGDLPSEAELMLEFRCSRNVVRGALAALQHEGLIVRIQGAGTFVVERKTTHRLDHVRGLSDSVPGSSRRVHTRLLSAHIEPVPSIVARRLEIADGSSVVVIETVTCVDGTPNVLSTSYVPLHPVGLALAPALAQTDWDGDWYNALQRVGHEVVRSELVAEAVAADDSTAPLLTVREGVALLRFERVLKRADGVAVDYGFVYCRGDRIALGIDLIRSSHVCCEGAAVAVLP
jgi:GntR family transcriptional regulator